MAFDVLKLLAELQEGGPRGGVQLPAVLHDLVDCRRAAVGGIHLVALLHPRDDILQGNSWIRHSPKGVDFPEEDSETPHVRLGGEFLPGGWTKQCQILGIWVSEAGVNSLCPLVTLGHTLLSPPTAVVRGRGNVVLSPLLPSPILSLQPQIPVEGLEAREGRGEMGPTTAL